MLRATDTDRNTSGNGMMLARHVAGWFELNDNEKIGILDLNLEGKPLEHISLLSELNFLTEQA